MENQPKEIIKPDIVIVHCSATPDLLPSDANYDKFNITHIDQWHRERGFSSCGYHLVITRGGVIQHGREMYPLAASVEKGAHCYGQNYRSIGICYIGTKNPTEAQMKAFGAIYRTIEKPYAISFKDWMPHNRFAAKLCPGFDISEIKRYI
jgi:hypothetical protein